MADKFNSRTVDPVFFKTYHGPPADLPVSEPLRESRYQNVQDVEGTATYPMPELGQGYTTYDGRVFRFVKFTAAAAEGNVLTHAAPVAIGTTVTSDSSFTELTKTAAFGTVNQYQGYFCSVTAGGQNGFTRRVVGNTADTIFLEDPLPGALNGSSTLSLWHPYAVRLTVAGAANTRKVCGVAIGTITGNGYFGFMQVFGHCDTVLVDAAVAGDGVLTGSSAVAGQALEATSSLLTSAPFATSQNTQVGGTNVGIPAFLWGCLG